MSLVVCKSTLRKEINKVISSLTKAEIDRQSEIVTNKVLQTSAFKDAKSVSIYLSMDVEVQTEELLRNIFINNKECFIPSAIYGAEIFKMGSSEMEMIKLKSLEEYHNLPSNKWNIKQHADNQQLESIFDKDSLDLILVPGLGFTQDGRRLGRGKGYYDKFFAKCEQHFSTPPKTIGLALNEQILQDIPMDKYDRALDLVLCAGN